MSFNDILTMRHELMLTLLTLIVLIIDLNLCDRKKHTIIPITLALFFVHTLVGFLPNGDTELLVKLQIMACNHLIAPYILRLNLLHVIPVGLSRMDGIVDGPEEVMPFQSLLHIQGPWPDLLSG